MDKNEILAVVGGREIKTSDLEMLMRGLDPRAAAQFNSEEGKKMLLEELINQELLYLDAINEGIDESEEYKAELERARVNILKQLSMNKLMKSVTVEEGEIINYYNQNKSMLKTPDTVRASHILVSEEQKAVEILEEINKGMSFESASEQYSVCPSKEKGGDLGYFEKSKMVPEFGKAAFEMEVGQISQPVKTQFGYHIIKLVDKKEGGIKSLDEVKSQLVQQVLLKKQQDKYLEKTAELKSKYEVKIS